MAVHGTPVMATPWLDMALQSVLPTYLGHELVDGAVPGAHASLTTAEAFHEGVLSR